MQLNEIVNRPETIQWSF